MHILHSKRRCQRYAHPLHLFGGSDDTEAHRFHHSIPPYQITVDASTSGPIAGSMI